jgi:hypothetical protein
MCSTCNTSPTRDASGVSACQCPNKVWEYPQTVRADSHTEYHLKRKGFNWIESKREYCHPDDTLIRIYEDGTWEPIPWPFSEDTMAPINNLTEYLEALPNYPPPRRN